MSTIIKLRSRGPYQIKGEVELLDEQGNPIAQPQGSSLMLCRCGASKRKPFCDGAHNRVDFDKA